MNVGLSVKPDARSRDVSQLRDHAAEVVVAPDGVVPELDAPSRARLGWSHSSLPVMLVLVAIAFAALAQGAFYWPQLRVTAVLIFIGLAIAAAGRRFSWRECDGPIVAAVAFGCWYLVCGAIAGNVGGAMPAVVLLGAMAAIVLIVRRLAANDRRFVLAGLVGIGTVVAFTGWVGVAWRVTPWALEDGGLWRAASTITYANATGALLAALALLAIGAFVVAHKSPLVILATYVLVVGALATASRASLVSFALGALVLGVWTRGRVLRPMAPVLIGSLIAFGALVPSMPATHRADPAIAVIGLAVGAAVSLASPRLITITIIGVIAAAIAIAGIQIHAINGFTTLQHDRVTTSSPDRAQEVRAALRVAGQHPITGVGPGNLDLAWTVSAPTPSTMHVRYAHDEYLQVVDEVGGVGFIILALGLVTVGAAIWRGRRDLDVVAAAGCVSALVALAVGSSLDFLWHIPVVGLTGAVLVGVLLPRAPAHETSGHPKETP
jgi:O-antigen ligase